MLVEAFAAAFKAAVEKREPCIIECMLENGIRPTVFYCNPNIYPQAEYEIRKNEAIRFVTSKNIDFIDADYDYAHWLHTMQGLEHEPERGSRCLKCFTLSMVSPYSLPPLPLRAGKAWSKSMKPDAVPPRSIWAPSSGNRIGGKADFKTGATNC